MFDRKDKFESFSDGSDDEGKAPQKKRLTGFQQFYAKDNEEYMKKLNRRKGVRYMRFTFLMFFIITGYAAYETIKDHGDFNLDDINIDTPANNTTDPVEPTPIPDSEPTTDPNTD